MLPITRFAVLSALALPNAAMADTCAPVPPAVTDIALERYYDDGVGSHIDPKRFADHKAKTAPLVAFVGTVTKFADRAHQQRSAPAATYACALRWLRNWADGGAYLGKIAGKQAEAQRRWDLAGLALGYLKLKRAASEADRAAIEPWLLRMADAAYAHFDDPGIKRNNHWYWLGLGQGAVGLATGSEPHWQRAKAIMLDATQAITADGTLPLELAREGRALHYHAFAVMPLVALAELGFARSDDWYAQSDGALHRLVAKTAEGIKDPSTFDKLAGHAQARPVKSGAGWVSLYNERFIGRLGTRPEQPVGHRYLGGDVLVLRTVLDGIR